MLTAIALIVLASGVLYGGAEGLVRGSASLASRWGVSPLVIGLTVVAFGTSMPELLVSVSAALDGAAPIAVGNVVGSNISNIALILGVCALIAPLAVHAQIVRVDLPVLVIATFAFILILRDDLVSRGEGAILLAALAVYAIGSWRLARSEADFLEAEFAETVPAVRHHFWLDAVLILGGLIGLVVGARLLIVGSVTIAQSLGISEAVIGLTVVAIGTSLPELATSVLATMKRHGDMAIGNVVGSCIFNIFGIIGTASLVRPLAQIGMTVVDLAVMAVLTLLLLPMLRSGFRLSRTEGLALLGAYAAYVTYLFV